MPRATAFLRAVRGGRPGRMIATAHPRLSAKMIDSLYVEAMLLADEARGYFDLYGRTDRDALAPIERVGFSCESLRVTTRLMHIIAWLLTRKAVAAGEINEAQAIAPERRLGRGQGNDADMVEGLPETARQIVAATGDLYRRVMRLDAEMGRPEIAQSPARSADAAARRRISGGVVRSMERFPGESRGLGPYALFERRARHATRAWAPACAGNGLLRAVRHLVDRARQVDVAHRQAAGIVRRQQDVDLVVDVGPFGMMIRRLGEQRDLRHETERRDEVGEDEAARQPVARRLVRPAGQRRQQRGAFAPRRAFRPSAQPSTVCSIAPKMA